MKKIKTASTKTTAAYHEAGHAFMFMFFQMSPKYTKIDKSGNGYTECPMIFPSEIAATSPPEYLKSYFKKICFNKFGRLCC